MVYPVIIPSSNSYQLQDFFHPQIYVMFGDLVLNLKKKVYSHFFGRQSVGRLKIQTRLLPHLYVQTIHEHGTILVGRTAMFFCLIYVHPFSRNILKRWQGLLNGETAGNHCRFHSFTCRAANDTRKQRLSNLLQIAETACIHCLTHHGPDRTFPLISMMHCPERTSPLPSNFFWAGAFQ